MYAQLPVIRLVWLEYVGSKQLDISLQGEVKWLSTSITKLHEQYVTGWHGSVFGGCNIHESIQADSPCLYYLHCYCTFHIP